MDGTDIPHERSISGMIALNPSPVRVSYEDDTLGRGQGTERALRVAKTYVYALTLHKRKHIPKPLVFFTWLWNLTSR